MRHAILSRHDESRCHVRAFMVLIIALLTAACDSGNAGASRSLPAAPAGAADALTLKCTHRGLVSSVSAFMTQKVDLIDDPIAHDCQKFVHDPWIGGKKFLAKAAILAEASVATMTDKEFMDNKGTAFRLAWIEKYDAIEYDDLNLPARIATLCLYVGLKQGATDIGDSKDWKAEISENCEESSRSINSKGRTMKVSRMHGTTIPAAARFHWEKNKRYTAGVRCGSGWCRVSNKAPGKIADVVSNVDSMLAPRWDEQVLAVGPAGALKPGKALAVIVPDPNIGSYTDSAFAADLQPVARVWMSDTEKHYAGTLNFGKGWNTIKIQKDSTGQWFAEIVDSLGKIKNKKVNWYSSTVAEGPPPVARWAWSDADEMGWVRCSFGCCEITADNY